MKKGAKDIHEAIKVVQALITIKEFLGIETINHLASRLSLFATDEAIFSKLKDVTDTYSDFYELPLEKRAEKLGYSYSKHPDGSEEVSTTL